MFRRRITALFASGFVAFSLTTWLLTRSKSGDAAHDASTAEGVVRMQLDALAQNELQTAYSVFSPQYRAEVPFATFRDVIATHGEMFRAKTIAIDAVTATASRDELRVRIISADGQHYVARYSVILLEGRWWIDAMHWHADEEAPERVLTAVPRAIDTARRGA